MLSPVSIQQMHEVEAHLSMVPLPTRQVKHSLDQLFAGLLRDVLTSKPAEPLQYIIDSLSLGPDLAAQVRAHACHDGQYLLSTTGDNHDTHTVTVCCCQASEPLLYCKDGTSISDVGHMVLLSSSG